MYLLAKYKYLSDFCKKKSMKVVRDIQIMTLVIFKFTHLQHHNIFP